MSNERIIQALEEHLSASQSLDAAYYSNPNPTPADRAAYHQRQERIEALRHLLDVSLNETLPTAPDGDPKYARPCRPCLRTSYSEKKIG